MAVTLFIKMLIGHALADFPLQGCFLARARNHHDPVPELHFLWALFYHGVIHGGAVYLVTGSVFLGTMECSMHILIDFFKTEGFFSPTVDQCLHLLCKAMWAALATSGVVWP